MITRPNVAPIYVLDKDEALDFYVNKLGLEMGKDLRQGDYRWLTVRVRARRHRSLARVAWHAAHDEATTEQLRELITKGARRPRLHHRRCAGLYETLKERGVKDFTQEPTDHFYGTDMGLRDPSATPSGSSSRARRPQKADAPRTSPLIQGSRRTTCRPSRQPRSTVRNADKVFTEAERAAVAATARERKAASGRSPGPGTGRWPQGPPGRPGEDASGRLGDG